MTNLRSPKVCRLVAGTLSALLLVPSTLARAATANTRFDTGTLCVVEFSDLSRSGARNLGPLAADRFSVSIADAVSPGVVPQAERLRRQRELQISGPLGRSDRAKLAVASGAGRVVYGTITSARVTGTKHQQARVRLTVLVEEARSGKLLYGAVSEGASAPATTPDREKLLHEAFANAAESFARYLADPEAVRNAEGPRVVAANRDLRIQKDTLAQNESSAQPAPLVNAGASQQRLESVSVPPPVVVDIPGGTLDGRRDRERRPLISRETWRLLVGGVLVMGLVYLAGAGGFGATRPF